MNERATVPCGVKDCPRSAHWITWLEGGTPIAVCGRHHNTGIMNAILQKQTVHSVAFKVLTPKGED